MIIDSHCHLYYDVFDADRAQMIDRAVQSGVKYFVNVGTDPATNEAAMKVANDFDRVFFTAGLHPHHSHEVDEKGLDEVDAFVGKNKPVAIGEIGLDNFKSLMPLEKQIPVFRRMLRMALKYDMPVIVHSRDAFEQTLAVMDEENTSKRLQAVMHCFSYDYDSLRSWLDRGYLASFTCNVTYKSAQNLLEVAAKAPLDRIMLETDAPYLAPQAFRGKRNEPSYLTLLSDLLSEKRSIDKNILEHQTTANAIRFFSLNIANES